MNRESPTPPRYEYGVRYFRDPADWEPHRSGLTETEAREWIREWAEEGGRADAFVLVRREIAPWEIVP